MTVEILLEKLQKMDKNATVRLHDFNGDELLFLHESKNKENVLLRSSCVSDFKKEIFGRLSEIPSIGKEAVYADMRKDRISPDSIKILAGFDIYAEYMDYLFEQLYDLPSKSVRWCRQNASRKNKNLRSKDLWNMYKDKYYSSPSKEYIEIDTITDEYYERENSLPEGAIVWCREHAMPMLKGLPTEELWNNMKDAYYKSNSSQPGKKKNNILRKENKV